ncbi:MAG: FliM/FliN family flagellar motor switch protein [Terracidiphilus sp.]|jgi:flagellar motor switch protein FliN
MKTYCECWIGVAKALFAQALAGEPEFAESPLPSPPGAMFAFAATVSGDVEGRFEVLIEDTILESPLLGEGVDQKAGWGELLREVADAAAGELLAGTGINCQVEKFEEATGEIQASRSFQLKCGKRVFAIMVRDRVANSRTADQPSAARGASTADGLPANTSSGIELLLDVELEATLRFGCRELPLEEILDLGPGDVVQLDRHVSDPVDLVVGDKIVARGEVVLVNGNFGLRVTEVAAPRKRLESIRCLF